MIAGRRNLERLMSGLVLASLTAGCGILDPTVCTTEAVPGIRVEVLDSISGAPVRGHLRVVARDGSETSAFDSQVDAVLQPGMDPDTMVFSPVSLAYERAGTYALTAEAEGYRPWQRTGVRVHRGECHVQTVEVTARLQPM